jgi:hypothetical protein
MKVWDKIKVGSFFPLNVANLILETPLFDMVEEDKLLWMDSPHGTYNVKSGYNLLCNFSGKLQGADTQDDWSSIWKIHAPSKAKNLLWRICKGYAYLHEQDCKSDMFLVRLLVHCAIISWRMIGM